MTLTLPDVLVAVVLFTCVPLQLFLVWNWGEAESGRAYALNKFLNHISKFRDEYLSLNSWKVWIVQQLHLEHLFPSLVTKVDEDEGESPAIEVIRYQNKHGYFSFSPDPRNNRPPSVEFRVGQVIVHRDSNYRGVIVGWDEVAKAPKEWLDEMHGDNKVMREMPNYSILVDTRDRLSPQLTYVPQVKIEILKNTRIIHPLIDNHFENFDGVQYIPRPWLKEIYPQD